jgi:hypothetical protein
VSESHLVNQNIEISKPEIHIESEADDYTTSSRSHEPITVAKSYETIPSSISPALSCYQACSAPEAGSLKICTSSSTAATSAVAKSAHTVVAVSMSESESEAVNYTNNMLQEAPVSSQSQASEPEPFPAKHETRRAHLPSHLHSSQESAPGSAQSERDISCPERAQIHETPGAHKSENAHGRVMLGVNKSERLRQLEEELASLESDVDARRRNERERLLSDLGVKRDRRRDSDCRNPDVHHGKLVIQRCSSDNERGFGGAKMGRRDGHGRASAGKNACYKLPS